MIANSTTIPGAAWFKASASLGNDDCIEIADLRGTTLDGVAVRDSKDVTGPAFVVSPTAFSAFVAGIRV